MPSLELDSRVLEAPTITTNRTVSRLGRNPNVEDRITGVNGWTTTFDPTIDQGATPNITHTLVWSNWRYDGPMIEWQFVLGITGAGTAGAAVLVDLPVPHVSSAVIVPIGSGDVYDASVARYPCALYLATSGTQLAFYYNGAAAWGVTPNAALANTDGLGGTVRYRWV